MIECYARILPAFDLNILLYLFFKWPFPASFCLIFVLSEQLTHNKSCRLQWDSNLYLEGEKYDPLTTTTFAQFVLVYSWYPVVCFLDCYSLYHSTTLTLVQIYHFVCKLTHSGQWLWHSGWLQHQRTRVRIHRRK